MRGREIDRQLELAGLISRSPLVKVRAFSENKSVAIGARRDV
jgi:hypothetical protein